MTLYTTHNFDGSSFGVAWTFILTLLALIGLLLCVVYFRYVTDAPLKSVYFLVLAVGGGFTLSQIMGGSLTEITPSNHDVWHRC